MLRHIGLRAIAELQDDLRIIAPALRQVGAVVTPALVNDAPIIPARLCNRRRMIAPDLPHIGARPNIAVDGIERDGRAQRARFLRIARIQ